MGVITHDEYDEVSEHTCCEVVLDLVIEAYRHARAYNRAVLEYGDVALMDGPELRSVCGLLNFLFSRNTMVRDETANWRGVSSVADSSDDLLLEWVKYGRAEFPVDDVERKIRDRFGLGEAVSLTDLCDYDPRFGETSFFKYLPYVPGSEHTDSEPGKLLFVYRNEQFPIFEGAKQYTEVDTTNLMTVMYVLTDTITSPGSLMSPERFALSDAISEIDFTEGAELSRRLKDPPSPPREVTANGTSQGKLRLAVDFIKAKPGRSAKEIANHLGIAESTFLSHYARKLRLHGVEHDKDCGGYVPR